MAQLALTDPDAESTPDEVASAVVESFSGRWDGVRVSTVDSDTSAFSVYFEDTYREDLTWSDVEGAISGHLDALGFDKVPTGNSYDPDGGSGFEEIFRVVEK